VRFMLIACDSADETEDEGPSDLPGDPHFAWWNREMRRRGATGERLRPAATAVTVRVLDGEIVWADGPFAESTEVMSRFDLVECASLAEAVDLAARHPCARAGAVEIRPIWDAPRYIPPPPELLERVIRGLRNLPPDSPLPPAS
jgi:hypothetical protein